MIKSIFKFGSHLFLISSILSFLFKFGHHEEEKHEEEKRCSSIGKILAVVGTVAALGFLFEEKRKRDEHEHHLF